MKKRSDVLKFPKIVPEVLVRSLEDLPIAGKVRTPKTATSCHLCRRRAEPLLRLVRVGVPICDRPECHVVRIPSVLRLFPGAYGRAMNRSTLAIFCRIVESTTVAWAEKRALLEHAEELAEGMRDLVEWQAAWDRYECWEFPDQYDQGKVSMLPPRHIEDVLVIRSRGRFERRDPTADLDPRIRKKIRGYRERGDDAAPF